MKTPAWLQTYVETRVFWRGRWISRGTLLKRTTRLPLQTQNFLLQQADLASHREARRVLYGGCAQAMTRRYGPRTINPRRVKTKDIRWVPRRRVFCVFDAQRLSLGAWTREEAAQQVFAATPGATLLVCQDFAGLFPHDAFVKRDVLWKVERAA